MASTKKDPFRFQIRLDESDPIQCKVAEILSGQGRGLSKFISDAVVVATENQPTVTEWLTMQQQFLSDAARYGTGVTYETPPTNRNDNPKVESKRQEPAAVPSAPVDRTEVKSTVEPSDDDNGFHIDFDEDTDDDASEDLDDFALGMTAFG